ncbi:MAG: sulfatase-like hydrolase/transferase [Kiritimatiellales bacterium]|nr:sulfatase-like hydrolase/transferase [Kiritimatiellales bacterium]
MKRRCFLAGSTMTATAALVVGKPGKRKPNVLFIITDDQSVDHFGYLKGSKLMPNVNQLGEEGVCFTRAYATSSVCTPSRYTCLTGRYASRSQCRRFTSGQPVEGQTWVQWNADVAAHEWTVAKLLKKNGYTTGLVGKLHGLDELGQLPKSIGSKSDPDDPEVDAALRQQQKDTAELLKEYGFDYAAAMNHGNMGSRSKFPKKLCEHTPEWKLDAALKFVEQNKDKPFYLYYATTLTHGPDPIQSLNADPIYTEGGKLDKVLDVQPSRQEVIKRGEAIGAKKNDFGAMWLDDSIGVLLEKIKSLGLKEDTLVVFFNDHGCDGGKGSVYENGIRTPVIISWPGTIKPQQSDKIVANIDFAPTIFSACSVVKPKDYLVDGIDLMPLLTGKAKTTRDSLLCEMGHTRSVVSKDWKYLAFRVPPSRVRTPEQVKVEIKEYYAGKTGGKAGMVEKIAVANPGYRVTHIHRFPGGDGTELGNAVKSRGETYFDPDQLYDINKDPDELENLAANPEYKAVLEKMQAEMKKHLANLPGSFGELKTK